MCNFVRRSPCEVTFFNNKTMPLSLMVIVATNIVTKTLCMGSVVIFPKVR